VGLVGQGVARLGRDVRKAVDDDDDDDSYLRLAVQHSI